MRRGARHSREAARVRLVLADIRAVVVVAPQNERERRLASTEITAVERMQGSKQGSSVEERCQLVHLPKQARPFVLSHLFLAACWVELLDHRQWLARLAGRPQPSSRRAGKLGLRAQVRHPTASETGR